MNSRTERRGCVSSWNTDLIGRLPEDRVGGCQFARAMDRWCEARICSVGAVPERSKPTTKIGLSLEWPLPSRSNLVGYFGCFKHADDQKIGLDLDDRAKVNCGRLGDLSAESQAIKDGSEEE